MSSEHDAGCPAETTVDTQDREGFINPVRMCAPIGAMIGTIGIHGGVPLIHGSNGCATYPRHEMNRHFEEPVETGVTSLTEGSTVFGGSDNLIDGLENVNERTNPELITAISTCLSETIGDDVEGIVTEYEATTEGLEVPVVAVEAPSYIGTHITGMDNFVTKLIREFPEPGKPTNRLNVIPGWVDPGDIREIRHLVEEIGADPLWLTDYSDPLDGGLYQEDPEHPPGGTPIEDLQDAANSRGTVALQKRVGGDGARILAEEHNQQVAIGPMPVGVRNTDLFVEAVTTITGQERSERLRKERARLLDAIVDAHMYLTGLRVAVFGDPDWIEGITEFLAEAGTEPVHALTSFESEAWAEDMVEVAERHDLDLNVRHESDLQELADLIDDEPVDLLVGPSKGKYLADDEDIPLVRTGFPVEDRFGYHRRATVGYRGSMNLLDDVVNAFLRGGNDRLVSNTQLDTGLEGGER